MKITIDPIADVTGRAETEIIVAGDMITIDGVLYDLSAIPEGGDALPEGDHPFLGLITREAGNIVCTVTCIYDAATALPDQPIEPAHWVIDVDDGPVTLPINRLETDA